MKIPTVKANNRRKAFEIRTSSKDFKVQARRGYYAVAPDNN